MTKRCCHLCENEISRHNHLRLVPFHEMMQEEPMNPNTEWVPLEWDFTESPEGAYLCRRCFLCAQDRGQVYRGASFQNSARGCR